jgi:hypothetical protein
VETARQNTDWLAGAAGFEPAHGGTKSRCLTAWLRPNRGRTLVPGRATGKPLLALIGKAEFPASDRAGGDNTRLRKTRSGDIHRVARNGV